MISLIILFVLVSSHIVIINAAQYCVNDSTISYDFEGNPAIIGTFVNCLKSVQDAMIAPFYDNTRRINVSTEVFLNNLISVNEVESAVTLDIYFSTSWVRIEASIDILTY